MTLFGESAFIILRESVASEAEFVKTLLHQIYRVEFQKGVQAGAAGAATEPTASAFNFAENAYKL